MSNRPDWHMRWPFALALAALAIGASFLEWWAGLAMLGWVVAMFAWYRLGGW